MKFDFKIHDKVKIKELNLTGRIKAIYIDSDGISYSIRFFKDGDPKTTYFYSDELEKMDNVKGGIGYK